jgi:hypothetical protein
MTTGVRKFILSNLSFADNERVVRVGITLGGGVAAAREQMPTQYFLYLKNGIFFGLLS